MALDEAMLDCAIDIGLPLLRLYQWSADSVSMGANEAAQRTWDRERLAADGVPCVRRPTGGRAVWHAANDLTYAWSGPSNAPAGVRQTYRILHEHLATALAGSGRETVLAGSPSRAPGLIPGACFEAAVGGEVLVEGRKVVGSAQLVRGAALLQHGAIAVADRTGELARYRRGSPSEAGLGGGGPQLAEAGVIRDLIADYWRAGGATEVSPEVVSRIEKLGTTLTARFEDDTWTWRR